MGNPPSEDRRTVSSRYRRSPKVEAAPMQGETILYHPDTNRFCTLNGTAAFLWTRLERDQTLEELAAAVCERYDGVVAATARSDVQAALQEFAAQQLVVEA